MGLHPGLDILIIDKTAQRVSFWADGNEHVLSPLIAANISVLPAPEKWQRRSKRFQASVYGS